MKNMIKKAWNSEIFEAFSEITYGILTTLNDAIVNIFSNNEENNNISNDNSDTYDYFMRLTSEEQREYFENNEYLNEYLNDFYENNRYQTAKVTQEIANRLGRQFTNKYDRY